MQDLLTSSAAPPHVACGTSSRDLRHLLMWPAARLHVRIVTIGKSFGRTGIQSPKALKTHFNMSLYKPKMTAISAKQTFMRPTLDKKVGT